MFEMFPFLINNMMSGIFSGSMNNNNNNIDYNQKSFSSGNNIISIFGGTFNSVFNQVFTTLITNEELMNNIVDTVLNSDVVGSVLDSIEDESNLDFIDYGDRYLIEGKLLGINKKDIDIDYEEDHITIKVKKNQVFSNENSMVAVFQEGSSFQKSFYVPNIESNSIKAVYNADVLRIYLKKSPPVEKGTTIIDVDNFTNADSPIEVGNFNEISDMDKSTKLYNQSYIE